MKIFITGATGYIGGAVAAELKRHGHEISALVRPDSDTRRLKNIGAVLVNGDLRSLPGMADEIASHNVFIHTAMAGQDSIEQDAIAVDAFTRPHLSGHFLYTSGVWVFGNTTGGPADETSPVKPLSLVAWRPGHEEKVLAAERAELRTSVIRPGCVYGHEQSLFKGWFAAAEKGEGIEVIGDGQNRWSLIDLEDLAVCYRLAIEKKLGGILHATDDSRLSMMQVAEAIRDAGGGQSTVTKLPLAEAQQKMGAFAEAFVVDQEISSAATRKALGWSLTSRDFLSSIARQWSLWEKASARR